MRMDDGGLSESLDGDINGDASSSHGWQKVINTKKLKRQEKGSKHSGSSALNPKPYLNPEVQAFEDVEKVAEDRRHRRNARAVSGLINQVGVGAVVGNGGGDTEKDSEQVQVDAVGNEDGKKPKPTKVKKPRVTVAEAAAAIDAAHLGHFLLEISDLYHSLPEVQLMRCMDYFGRAFNSVSAAQFAWGKINKGPMSKAIEEPFCHLPDAVIRIMYEWLAARPAQAFPSFIHRALMDIIEDDESHQGFQKNEKTSFPSPRKSKVAVLVVLALILRKRPETLLQQAAKIRCTPEFQGQEKLATLIWAYGQVAQGDLVAGMSLWVQNLLPLATGKSSTPVSRDLILQFVESVIFGDMKKARPILLNAVSRKGERLVPPSALEPLMRLAFPVESARTKATERFLAIYPVVKELALAGSYRSKSTRPVAQQLLPFCLQAASEGGPELSTEAFHIFRWCLSQNSDCYKQWVKLHVENLKGSVCIIDSLCSEWKESQAQLMPLEDIRRTVSALRAKHCSSLECAKGDIQLEALLHTADNSCKALERKLTRVIIYVKAVATLFGALALAYACYSLSPNVNPWNWDGQVLLSKTHKFI